MSGAKQQGIMAALGLPAGALVVSLLVFGVFVAGSGANPFTAYTLMYMGGFGTWFSWQNTLQQAAPLILTALCTSLLLTYIAIAVFNHLVEGPMRAPASLCSAWGGWCHDRDRPGLVGGTPGGIRWRHALQHTVSICEFRGAAHGEERPY